jgi:hypothetical protein
LEAAWAFIGFHRKKREMDPDADADNGCGKALLTDECRNGLRILVIDVLRPLNSGVSEIRALIEA